MEFIGYAGMTTALLGYWWITRHRLGIGHTSALISSVLLGVYTFYHGAYANVVLSVLWFFIAMYGLYGVLNKSCRVM